MLFKKHAAYVGVVCYRVDQHEVRVGELAGDSLDRIGLQEARRHDKLGALKGDAALPLGGGVGRTLELEKVDLNIHL